MILFYFSIAIVVGLIVLNYIYRARGYKGPRSDHFNGRHFHNIFLGTVNDISYTVPLVEQFPRLSFALKKIRTTWKPRPLPEGQKIPQKRVFGKDIVITYVNHSTVLIQTEGVNILTDPIWSHRASPLPFFGPKRYMDPGVDLHKLPPIDFILLSHNHYDHMDLWTLRQIVRGHDPLIYTTLGNKKYLASYGIHNTVELDWGHAVRFSDLVSIDCVPAQHFSARAISDRRKTLWGGFVILLLHGDIYFAGDTGYGPHISHIQKMYPDGFRFGLLPIGAFEPRLYMKTYHTGPDEAITIYKDLGVRRAMPIHFGTFDLSLEAQDVPVDRLNTLLELEENKDVRFDILYNGMTLTVQD
jgi:L-ascorbate metabolism protein UlaG (beta-lactamase superfamily)